MTGGPVRSWVAVIALGAGCAQEQGLSEQRGTDTWRQADNNEVDILFVVDESCSMVEEQATLAAGFSTFAGQLEASATDFRLGVITTTFDHTDPERGKLVGEPPYLTLADPDYAARFAARAQVGTQGSDQERGLEAALWAVSPLANLDLNAGFIRRSARLLMVFVSDEEDCSDGGALTGMDQLLCYERPDLLTPIGDLVDRFRGLKDQRDDVMAAAIIGVDGDVCQNVYPSRRLRRAAELLGGRVGNICDGDWSEMLGELGLNATGVVDRFQLSRGAVEDTLEVTVDGEPVLADPVTGWSYDADTWYLTFAPAAVPPRGSEIVARYTVRPGPRPE